MKRAVAYYRVSTERQGESGLGLDAQKDAVRQYIKAKRIELVDEFIEIESGKRNTRPVLREALDFCKGNKVLLIIAKLDRLGRNVAFISSLMESKVKFVAVDNSEANDLVLHILAAFAEYEREQISQRTKAALKSAKDRGVVLGQNGKALAEQNKKASLRFSKKMAPVIERLRKNGFESVRELADALNAQGVPTYTQQGKWHVSTVHTLIKKIDGIKQ